MHKTTFFTLLFVVCLALVACQSAPVAPTAVIQTVEVPLVQTVPVEVTVFVEVEVTREIARPQLVEVTPSPLGSELRPIQLLFPPQFSTAVIQARATVLADSLAQATGQKFEVGVLDSETAVISLLCSAPQDTIAFLSAVGYVVAQQQCGAQLGETAVRADGYTWQAGMIVYRPDSGITELADLAGKTWGQPTPPSLTTSLAFQAMFQEAGIETGPVTPLSGDTTAMLSVFNREVDFATAFYIPPILPYEERLWVYGEDSPEMWRLLGIPPRRSPIGYVFVGGETQYGGYRVRDARSGIFDTTPNIFAETRILALSPALPNDTIVFGAAFPLGLARQISAELEGFAATEPCATSLCSSDFYGWTGLEAANESQYEPVRQMMATLNLTAADLLK